jgi:hypothetical protein
MDQKKSVWMRRLLSMTLAGKTGERHIASSRKNKVDKSHVGLETLYRHKSNA